jgi:hypothetical protein
MKQTVQNVKTGEVKYRTFGPVPMRGAVHSVTNRSQNASRRVQFGTHPGRVP